MTDRIVDIADQGARLSLQHGCVLVEREGMPKTSVPLADLRILSLAHPEVRVSQPLLAAVAEAGGVVLVSGAQRLPVGMYLPLVGHHTQTARLMAQVSAPKPQQKRLWQQIIRAKVRAQGGLLERLHGTDHGLRKLAGRVRSGDTTNVEAQAARRYWPVLFGDPAFRRDHDRQDQNRLLNYGYAVLRAVVARAICAAGLHPSLGLHHHNRYNAYCLADDLMEPYRPLVDEAVYNHFKEFGSAAGLDRAAKQAVLEGLLGRCFLAGEARTLFDVAGRTAASLAQVFLKTAKQLVLPDA